MQSTHSTSGSAARSRRGEEKPRGVIVVAVGVFGIIIIGVLVYSMLFISANASNKVINQQKDYSLTNKEVVSALFAVAALEYPDTQNASCTLADSYQRPVRLVLRMKPYEVPDSCSIFVDDVLVQTVKRLEPDCLNACTEPEYDRGLSVGLVDYRDNHEIRVCCNSICVAENLDGLCHVNAAPVPAAAPAPDKKTLYVVLGGGIGVILFVGIVLMVSHHHRKL